MNHGKARIPGKMLVEMDDCIQAAVDSISARRGYGFLPLTHFQYLAALAVEYFLRRRAEHPDLLLAELKETVRHEEAGRYPVPADVADLNKLVLWMAPGIGQMLLMHLNYYQFLRHRKQLLPRGRIDNIVLLTLSERMSKEHIERMRASSISCFRHGEERGGYWDGRHPVRVLEFEKLTGARTRGNREVAPTYEFEGQNLIFVDEGRRREDGAAWLARRDELAKGGFVFEYSAILGESFEKSSNISEREDEYARAVVFNYSYRDFCRDGYDPNFKDFKVFV